MSDEWTSVPSRKKKRKKNGGGLSAVSVLEAKSQNDKLARLQQSRNAFLALSTNQQELLIADATTKLNTQLQAYAGHTVIDNIVETVLNALNGHDGVVDIVCYGIGPILSSHTAQVQLAALLALRQSLGVRVGICDVYDPLLSEVERHVLTSAFQVHVPYMNEEGKRKVNQDVFTIFYLPHCGDVLTNNVLWANWSNLAKLCIIGNSVSQSLELSTLRSTEQAKIACVSLLHTYLQEIPLPHKELKVVGAFNDMAVHTWAVPDQVWNEMSQPLEYVVPHEQTDPEIVTSVKTAIPALHLLPVELWSHVFMCLTAVDVTRLEQVSKQLRSAIMNDVVVWKQLARHAQCEYPIDMKSARAWKQQYMMECIVPCEGCLGKFLRERMLTCQECRDLFCSQCVVETCTECHCQLCQDCIKLRQLSDSSIACRLCQRAITAMEQDESL